MGWIGRVLGTDEGIKALVDAGDKVVFTQEEKAEHFAKVLKMYEPFKLAQRMLAAIFGVPYAIAWIVTFFASFFTDIDKQLELLTMSYVGDIVLAICAFYFLGGAGEGIIRRLAKR